MNKIRLVNQVLDTGDDAWSKYSCGICVAKMLMSFQKPELADIPIMTLLKRAFEKGGYIENIGWRHQALVNLVALYNVPMDFQKVFFDTQEKKNIGIKLINKKLDSGMPVAVSVLKEFDIPDSAHLVIVDGFYKIGPFIRGYKIVDPYPGCRGNRYKVSKNEFLKGWRGGMIWLQT